MLQISSAIVGFSSELVRISSELVQISSELVQFSSELVSTIAERLIISVFKKTTIAFPRSPILLRNTDSGAAFAFYLY